MKTLRYLPLILATVALAVGCQKSDEVPPAAPSISSQYKNAPTYTMTYDEQSIVDSQQAEYDALVASLSN